MVYTPNILITGIEGVGKSTILNLFPGDVILEIDDNFNEIFQKSILLPELNQIEQCILREIDLKEMLRNLDSYRTILDIVDIFCIVIDSTERNIEESEELIAELKFKMPDIQLFIIANFQDRVSISWSVEKIANRLDQKVYGFSAIQENSEEKLITILKKIIEITFFRNKKEIFHSLLKQEDYKVIWTEIEEARRNEKRRDFQAASNIFSNIATRLKNLKSEYEGKEIDALYYLCRAWQSLNLAEEQKNIKKFAEAEILFNQANEHFSDKNLKALLYANSIFCEILKLSFQFDESDNPNRKAEYYPKIRNLIKRAIDLYKEGGYLKDAEWAMNVLNTLKE